MVAAVACGDPQSSASEPTNTFIPTSTPTERPTLTPTGTPMPTSSFTPAIDPTATPTPERNPTPTGIPTATPTPPQTPSPTPTATPTPTAREVAVVHLAEIIPWFENPPDASHLEAAETLTYIWLRDAGLGDTVARLPWLADGVGTTEFFITRSLRLLGGTRSGRIGAESRMAIASATDS